MEFYSIDTITLIYCAMLFPLLAMAGNMAFSNSNNLRDTFTLLCAILTFLKISIRTILKESKNFYIISGGLVYRTVESIKLYMEVCNNKIYQKTAPLSTILE